MEEEGEMDKPIHLCDFNEIVNRYDIRPNFLRGKTCGTEQAEF